jgi:hypothetical protein
MPPRGSVSALDDPDAVKTARSPRSPRSVQGFLAGLVALAVGLWRHLSRGIFSTQRLCFADALGILLVELPAGRAEVLEISVLFSGSQRGHRRPAPFLLKLSSALKTANRVCGGYPVSRKRNANGKLSLEDQGARLHPTAAIEPIKP